MADHLIDIVDENNRLTGQVLARSVVHAQKLWHRTAHVYVYRHRSASHAPEFLVHLRSRNKDASPHKLDPRVGGHLETGETYAKGIIAELKEELGLSVKLKQLQIGPRAREEKIHEHIQYYFLEYTDALGKIKPDPEEIEKISWLSKDVLINKIQTEPKKWIETALSTLKIIESIK